MKKCNTCKQDKPLSEFQKRAANKDGHTYMCKVCKRAYDNAHYKANPQRRSYIRENSDARIAANRAWVLEYLNNNPCIDCGEEDVVVLEFDHREDKKRAVSLAIRRWNLESLQKEVAKCDVRCANCHRRKTARDFGYWRLVEC